MLCHHPLAACSPNGLCVINAFTSHLYKEKESVTWCVIGTNVRICHVKTANLVAG